MSGLLILIPVPGMSAEGTPVVRVVVVPKLDAAPTVADAGLPDWPETLAAAVFQVVLDDGAGFDARPVHDADVAVWRAFFATLRVDAPPPPVIGDPPVVRRTSVEANAIHETYVAAAGVDVRADDAVQANLGVAAARALRTHWSQPLAEVTAPDAEAEPVSTDFHRVLTMLREHPAVLRRLGLVFDLPVPLASLADEGTVRVRWANPPAGTPRPTGLSAAYELDDYRGFVPGRSRTVRAGIVDLSDEEAWGTATVDVDNAVIRLRDAAAAGLGDPPAEGEEEPTDGRVRLPALRSAGIALLGKKRATEFADRRAAATTNAALPNIEDAVPLTADDLMLGLRIDVRFKGTTRWTSVMRRDARYTINEEDILPPAEEEGHVKAGAAVRTADAALRADEIVARWSGWSLAVPQNKPPSGPRADLPFDFGWEFDVPRGSLLPLRFGRDYHLRVRVVDLAGSGVGVDDRDVTMGTTAIPYRRYQPVPPPDLALPSGVDDLGPGGSLDLLVIRADEQEYPANDTRVLSASLCTLDVAENHGMLDGTDADTFARVQRALAGGLPDPAAAGAALFVVPEPGGIAARQEFSPWSAEWPDAPAKTIRLESRDDPDDPVVDPQDDLIRIRLAPAEQLRLAVSSFLRDGFLDHLALHQWRSSDAPTQVVTDGRHPMATPSREVTLIHAVRRQADDPAGSLTPTQVKNGLSAVLVAQPPLLGVDPASTQQLQITASWTEVDDERDTPMAGVAVRNVAVRRGDAALGEQIVHQFGDTRHRMVTYSLAAVSRFRHLYRSTEDADRFVARGTTDPVPIMSTARPAPPVVRAVVPAFRWDRSADGPVIRHVRHGGILRVELARPWRLTGDGEQLAVVVQQSEVGRDPIWVTRGLDRRLSDVDFAPGGGVPTTLPDGTAVTVVPFDVRFAADRWVADIDMVRPAERSYRPFVRLAVIRYQRHSLPACDTSTVVVGDLVQLLPTRTLTVDTTAPGSLVVRLDGLGPDGPPANRVAVTVEKLDGDGETDMTVLDNGGVAAWAGDATSYGGLAEPITVRRVHGRMRVRVREVERYSTALDQTGTSEEINERVVFTDVVDIP